MRVERSAGGIVFRRHPQEGLQVLLIQDSHGNWAFPKGRIEPGEQPVEAALRETREEVGLADLTPRASLGTIQFWYQDKWEQPGDKVKKFIEHFLLEASPDAIPAPQEDEGVQAACWATPEAVRHQVSYRTLRPTLKRLFRALNDLPHQATNL